MVGVGQFGAQRTQSTPRRSAPEVPRTLHTVIQEGSEDNGDPIISSPYADHFELRWNTPNDNGEPINSYEIRFCAVSSTKTQNFFNFFKFRIKILGLQSKRCLD